MNAEEQTVQYDKEGRDLNVFGVWSFNADELQTHFDARQELAQYVVDPAKVNYTETK